jgi:hypothetical protein
MKNKKQEIYFQQILKGIQFQNILRSSNFINLNKKTYFMELIIFSSRFRKIPQIRIKKNSTGSINGNLYPDFEFSTIRYMI